MQSCVALKNITMIELRCLVVLLILRIVGSYLHCKPNPTSSIIKSSNRKEEIKDEQWKIQQDILARRRNKGNMKKYFDQVDDNRKDLSKKVQGTMWARTKDSVDPIDKWKGARDKGMIKPIGYEPEPSRNESRLGFNVVIPINPMGIPKYDNGERFDLRLPYAERGYEDESADFMGNLMKGFRGIFGKPNNSATNKPNEDKIT